MDKQLEDRYVKVATIIFVLIALGLTFYLRSVGIVPSPEQIVSTIEGWYRDYGYPVIFFASILEGLVGINLYFPGSTAIVLGVVLAKQNGLSIPLMVAIIISGFLLSYIANYFIGRYSLHRLLNRLGMEQKLADVQQSITDRGPKILFGSFFHPNLAALMTTGSGIMKMKFSLFLLVSFGSLIFWYTFWGILAYLFGDYVLTALKSNFAPLLVIAWLLVAYCLTPKKKS